MSREDLAVDQLQSTVAALSDQQQREAAAATFFADHTLPVVEGNLCTFATRAAADSVYLRHRVNLWPGDLELALIPGTDVWFLTIELEWGARVEYQFEIVRNREWWRFNDPYNPRLARSPVGDCSVCYGPGYATPDWATFRAVGAAMAALRSGRPAWRAGWPGSSSAVAAGFPADPQAIGEVRREAHSWRRG